MNSPASCVHTAGIVVQGHQVASGLAKNSPFPRGTIEMQLPFFKKEGVNIDQLHPATINVSIAPKTFKLVAPKMTMQNIKWSKDHEAETFSLSPCILEIDGTEHSAYIYYPHPETKIGHFKDATTLEILSHFIADVSYGMSITLKININEITLSV